MRPFIQIFLALILMALSSLVVLAAKAGERTQSQPCLTGETACTLDDRSYFVLPPDNWDGETQLQVLVHFHGWGRQGHVPVKHAGIGGATRKAGILLVAPNGLNKSWDFWRPGSRDTDFTNAILDDVAKNFPINKSQIMVSGYSWGSSMAWRYSCESGKRVSVLLGISGTLYDQSEECATGPVEVRHVHGLTDTVMDFPYGPNGEETGPVNLWLRTNGCEGQAPLTSNWKTQQDYSRYEWSNCTSTKSVRLDVHGGGHWIAKGWMARQLQEIQGSTQLQSQSAVTPKT